MAAHEFSEECGISEGSCNTILTKDLSMKYVALKFVPRLLTTKKKKDRKFMSSELLERVCNDESL